MENLPVELQELLFSYLNGDTLLKACSVSKQWNLIISDLDRIWHKECEHIGSGLVKGEIQSWKNVYIVSRRKLHSLQNDHGFKTDSCVPGAMSCSAVRGLAYSQNHVLIGNHNMLYLIRISDQEIVAEFQVPYKLSFLAASEDGLIVGIGQHNGMVTSWRLECEKEISFQKLLEYQRHTSKITCICVKPESRLLCSSSEDRSVCLWQLKSGELLWTLNCHNMVQNVILVQSKTNALILKERNYIRRFIWPQGHINQIHELKPVMLANGKFVVKSIYLAYQTSDHIMVVDWHTGKQLYYFPLYCVSKIADSQKFITLPVISRCHVELIAMGTRFVLALLFDASERLYKIGTYDMLHGKIVGIHPIPRPEIIITGQTNWLNGLGYITKKDELVYAFIQNLGSTTRIQLVKWRTEHF